MISHEFMHGARNCYFNCIKLKFYNDFFVSISQERHNPKVSKPHKENILEYHIYIKWKKKLTNCFDKKYLYLEHRFLTDYKL